MSIWLQILLLGVLLVVAVFITLQKVQRWREERHPDVQAMQRLLDDIRAWLALRENPEPSAQEQQAGSCLPADLVGHLEQAAKLLVLCEAGQHPDLREKAQGRCAVFLVRRNHQHLRLAASDNLERLTRFARDLGSVLHLPVEMV